ncbi:MAG TPA: hypothetical protein VMY42_00010 [Thermoguttaceae bacterium]|nr:hypothetical protein [Thermoguttaceae bacterium]
MSVRERINDNIFVAIVLALLGTGVAVFFVVRTLSRPPGGVQPEWQTMVFFYDQNTGELLERPAGTQAPFETDSGPYQGMPAGVLAHVFACGQCSDESLRYIGWLEAPVDAVPAESISGKPDPLEEEQPGLIRRPDDQKWVYSNSPEGGALMQKAFAKCSTGSGPNWCSPLARRK